MITQRLFILTIIFCCDAVYVFSQKNKADEKFFAYDKDWKSLSNLDNATYFTRIKKVSDTCWEVNNYNLFGPMISKEVYKDGENKIAHGTWIFYKPNGYQDSICTFYNNLAHGKWSYTNDSNKVYLQKEFENGRLIAVHDIIKRDSINKAKEETEKKVKRDEKESEFPGGLNAWSRYLNNNLKFPDRALKGNMKGMVVVQFVVDTEGKVEMIDIYKSVEYSLDEEARRLIDKSPKWIPGTQDGRKVKTYKRQPIIFRTR
jgi:periplasmic protein TonB